jgi:hypothetical protein
MLASLTKTGRRAVGAFAMPLAWTMIPDVALQGPSPFEIDREEYERLLGESAQTVSVSPEELTCLVEAEVPSLWFL